MKKQIVLPVLNQEKIPHYVPVHLTNMIKSMVLVLNVVIDVKNVKMNTLVNSHVLQTEKQLLVHAQMAIGTKMVLNNVKNVIINVPLAQILILVLLVLKTENYQIVPVHQAHLKNKNPVKNVLTNVKLVTVVKASVVNVLTIASDPFYQLVHAKTDTIMSIKNQFVKNVAVNASPVETLTNVPIVQV